ncbi:hypothetical protein BDV12DRAFT_183449 [Aspergillus spectabilis]
MVRMVLSKIQKEYDWNSFVNQPDPEAESAHADSTKQLIWHVKQNFQKLIEGFLRWYLDNHGEMGCLFSYELRRKMTMLACTTLTDEYELDLGAKTQPPVKIDGLLFNTYHLVAHSTLRKMMTSTSARPEMLIQYSGYMRSNDVLKWKDVELFMIKHPGELNCVPPVFTYTERNDNLGLCDIQDILEYAFLDNAFASEHIKEPRDIWQYTQVPAHRPSTLIYFKKTLPYSLAQDHEIATSKSAGSKTPGSLYKYRKGAASKLKTPARDALIKLATNSSLPWDASARGTKLFKEFAKAKNEVRVKRKKLHKTAEAQHNNFFSSIGNHIVEQNYQGQPVCFKPDTSHLVPERIALADLEFKNRDTDQINDAELVEDYALVELKIPLQSKSGLQCPVCLGRSGLHGMARTYNYARRYTLQKLFETHQLPESFPKGCV